MDNSIAEGAYHLTPEYEKPSGKKRPSQSCPSFIADMEKDLSLAFERKKVYVPERRDENTLVGLKNLGATCYMNALLQSLFGDKAFRHAMYNWKGTSEEDDICYQLQILFAGLQNLNRTVFDTRPFTNAMGVLANIQQDAQEFFKFYVTYRRSIQEI
jgi:ubiquitin C-terminal hydrolase